MVLATAEKILSSRLFRSRLRPRLPSRTSVFAICGVAAGVMSLILVLSIMGGFERSLRSRILRYHPHLQWHPTGLSRQQITDSLDELEQLSQKHPSQIQRAAYSESSALAMTSGTVRPITFQGIEAAGWKQLRPSLIEGHFPVDDHDDSLVIGMELAEDLVVETGDRIELINPFEMDSIFIPLPTSRHYRISGIVRTGLYEWDQKGVWASKTVVDQYFGFSFESSRFAWWIQPIDQIDQVQIKFSKALADHTTLKPQHIYSWKELHRTIFHSMKIEQRSMFVLLLFVIAVASLNITILLTMTVNEKKPYIGMLMTLGMTPKRVMKIFSTHGFRLGAIGAGLGTIGGLGACLLLQKYPIVTLPDVYYDQSLPIHLNFYWVIVINVASLVIAYAASYFPARQAAQLDPIASIRTGR